MTQASEVSLNTGYLHLPATSYHYFAYGVHLGIGSKDRMFLVDFGMTPPFSSSGYRQTIYYGSLGGQWIQGSGFVRPYVGLGLGLFVDHISSGSSSLSGVVPSLVMRGGLKFGSDHFGAALGLTSHLGIYNFSHPFQWTMWPLTNVMLGVYVAI